MIHASAFAAFDQAFDRLTRRCDTAHEILAELAKPTPDEVDAAIDRLKAAERQSAHDRDLLEHVQRQALIGGSK